MPGRSHGRPDPGRPTDTTGHFANVHGPPAQAHTGRYSAGRGATGMLPYCPESRILRVVVIGASLDDLGARRPLGGGRCRLKSRTVRTATMSDASQPQSQTAPADLSGRKLGDYRLLRRLGRGAMAEVYLAEQVSLNRHVAVKVLKPGLATDQTYIHRFQREAQAAASLVHPNIVQIHEVGCIDGVHFIAQEYVQGLNLRQWMSRHGSPDLRMALIIMRQVAAALAKAAEQGIVHRDIKPENIMLTRSGEVKVADFGLARFPGKGESVDLTQAGMTLGTPLYMSPEQVEGRPLDPRSDLYSFGVTCYHMLAGSPPFGGETALSVAVQHLKKQADSLENLRRDLPPALCRIVHKMLAKAPENRYPSARELLRELRQVQLEHLEEQWPEDLPGWDVTEFDLIGTSRQEATQRLEALMKTTALARRGHRYWLVSLWAAAILTALLLGAGLAYFTTVEPSLLDQAENGPSSVPRYETVESQFIYALDKNTERAWQAIIDYHPTKTYYVNRANRQLALLYLQHDEPQKALEKFGALANLDESEGELRALGLVGQYWILTRQGRRQEATALVEDLASVVVKLRDPVSNRPQVQDPLINQMLRRLLRSSPEATTNEQIQQWLDNLEQEQNREPESEESSETN
jgi:serine/threonine protein kinase